MPHCVMFFIDCFSRSPPKSLLPLPRAVWAQCGRRAVLGSAGGSCRRALPLWLCALSSSPPSLSSPLDRGLRSGGSGGWVHVPQFAGVQVPRGCQPEGLVGCVSVLVATLVSDGDGCCMRCRLLPPAGRGRVGEGSSSFDSFPPASLACSASPAPRRRQGCVLLSVRHKIGTRIHCSLRTGEIGLRSR